MDHPHLFAAAESLRLRLRLSNWTASVDDVDDAIQSAILQHLLKAPSNVVDNADATYCWLRTAAGRHLCRSRLESSEQFNIEDVQNVDWDWSAIELQIDTELLLGRLPTTLREVVRLRLLGHASREIARKLALTDDVVRDRLRRARILARDWRA